MIVDDGNRICRQSSNDNSESPVIPVSRDFDGFTGGDSSATGDSKSWESLYWKSWIGCRATLDELGGNGIDFVDPERSIECSRDGIAFVCTEDVSVMASFNGKDRTCGGKVIFIGD